MANANAHAGDLSRSKVQDMNDSWPTHLELVGYWGSRRNGKRRSIEISSDRFFGRGGYGAPMTGDELIRMINELRRSG